MLGKARDYLDERSRFESMEEELGVTNRCSVTMGQEKKLKSYGYRRMVEEPCPVWALSDWLHVYDSLCVLKFTRV